MSNFTNKKDRDLLNTAISEYNNLTYDSKTELFFQNGTLCIGNPINGIETSFYRARMLASSYVYVSMNYFEPSLKISKDYGK